MSFSSLLARSVGSGRGVVGRAICKRRRPMRNNWEDSSRASGSSLQSQLGSR